MLISNRNCTACGACVQVCKQRCISLISNANGFLAMCYDKTNCINCGLCETVCHLDAEQSKISSQHAWAAVNNNNDELAVATSGGAFSALAKHVLQEDGVVYGCAYGERLKAEHIRIDNENQLISLNGSKYVQSDIGVAFLQTKRDLLAEKKVLFSGTPCQIAALNKFLKKEYDNLITVDIICHGVAPYTFFRKYLDWYESKKSCRVIDYSFRDKNNHGWGLAGTCTYEDDKGRKHISNVNYYDEFYYYYFLKGRIYGEACYSCRYANLNRPGDFTLGDLWGAESLNLPFSTDRGCSLLLTNNGKAWAILQKLQLKTFEISIDTAVKYNKQLSVPSEKPADYEHFVSWYNESSAPKIDMYFRRNELKGRIWGWIKHHIPDRIKKRLVSKR